MPLPAAISDGPHAAEEPLGDVRELVARNADAGVVDPYGGHPAAVRADVES